MARISLFLLGTFLLITAGVVSSAPVNRARQVPYEFSVQYFGDGTYTATYRKTERGTVTGTWSTSDGFMQLPEKRELGKIVGTCWFSPDKRWTCSTPERQFVDADGSENVESGSTMKGTNYTGVPGGPLKKA